MPGKTLPQDEADLFHATVCLYDLYRRRSAALNRLMSEADSAVRHLDAPPPEVIHTHDVTGPDELRATTTALRDESLRQFYSSPGVRLDSCGLAVTLFVEGPGRDSSHGARCRVVVNGTPVSVLICDTIMLGNFAIRPASGTEDRAAMTRFLLEACHPGG